MLLHSVFASATKKRHILFGSFDSSSITRSSAQITAVENSFFLTFMFRDATKTVGHSEDVLGGYRSLLSDSVAEGKMLALKEDASWKRRIEQQLEMKD